MIIQFTDNDFAVIQDCLTITRDSIRGKGLPTPNIDETMSRWGRWAHPSGCQFLVVTGEDAALIAAVTEPAA